MSETWRDQLELCSKCGKCRSVCPVFRETLDETMVARGRLALIDAVERGEISAAGDLLARAISTCIGCYRCVYECPTGTEVVDAVHGARGLWTSPRAVGRMVRLMLRRVVPYRFAYDAAMRVAAIAQKVLPRSERPPLRHLPLLLMDGRRIPNLVSPTFLQSVHGKTFEVPDPTGHVVFFVGCMINYVYPQVGHALVRVLNRRGVSITIPQGQVCCGTPALTFGDARAAEQLLAKNVKVLLEAGVRDVITACASCTRTLKCELMEHLDRHDRDRLRVYQATEYLGGLKMPDAAPLDMKVTYHDPCHLRWGQDISDAPRQLLRSVCAYEEMAGAEECCGFGGTFNILHYDLSQRIAARKAESIAGTDAEVVSTACPGCMLQLQTMVDERGLNRDIKHVVEVIDEAERKQVNGPS